MSTVKMKITFQEVMNAHNDGFAHYRDYLAVRFKIMGYIVTDFTKLRYQTFQDGDKSEYKIYTLVEGDVGGALMRVNAGRD